MKVKARQRCALNFWLVRLRRALERLIVLLWIIIIDRLNGGMNMAMVMAAGGARTPSL